MQPKAKQFVNENTVEMVPPVYYYTDRQANIVFNTSEDIQNITDSYIEKFGNQFPGRLTISWLMDISKF